MSEHNEKNRSEWNKIYGGTMESRMEEEAAVIGFIVIALFAIFIALLLWWVL